MELERRSSGVAKAGLTTGIIGTSLGTLGVLGAGANGIGNLLFGRNNQPVVVMDNGGYPAGGCCSEDHYVNRYELELQQKIAEKDSQIALPLRLSTTRRLQTMLCAFRQIWIAAARSCVIRSVTRDVSGSAMTT